MRDLKPQQLLDHVVTLANLVMVRKGNVIKIMTFDEYPRLYGVEKRVLQLKHADATEMATVLKPFVEEKGVTSGGQPSKLVADETGRKLVLLAPQPLLDSLVQLVATLDVPLKKDTIRIVVLKHLEAASIVPVLEQFLKGVGDRAGPGGTKPAAAVEGVEAARAAGDRWLVQFMVESKLNVIVLRGLSEDVEKTAQLIRQLDVKPDIEVASYPLQFPNAPEVFETLQEIVEEQDRFDGRGRRGASRWKISVSEQNNRIVVEGPPADHEYIAGVIAAIDRSLPAGSGGMHSGWAPFAKRKRHLDGSSPLP